MGCGCHDNENVRRKRIGNDLRFNWTILDGESPYDLEGRDLTLAIRSPFGVMPYGDLQIEGNVISFTLYGKDQKVNGLYTAILQENAGEIGMKTVDITDIVMLVPHTKDEGGEDRCSHLTVETIDLTSQLTAGIPGPKGVGIESVEQIQTSTENEGENIIRVTLTDGTTSYFSVRNGAKGSDANVTRQNIETALNGSGGKNLSTNDYTDEDKDKLAGVEEGANKNVKPDWNESDTDSDAFIRNKPDLSGFITRTVNDLANYYLKSETYTKEEVAALIGAIRQFHYEVYAALPATGEGNVLYLIGPTGSGSDKYEEYVYANNGWVKIGDTSIDLSGYVTIEALNQALSGYVTSAALATALTGKVGSETIHNIVELTQAEYDALQTKRGDTMYITTDTTKVYIGSRLIKENVKANEEDIDFDSSNKLQFADRVYNSSTPDGLGYVILRKNKTFAQQVTAQNTIYEIRYDFNLGGDEVTIPAGCVLKFNGGKIRNGTLTGDGTIVDAKEVETFTGVTIAGTWNVVDIFSVWFSNDADTLKNMVSMTSDTDTNNIYVDGDYTISSSVELKSHTNIYIKGVISGSLSIMLFLNDKDDVHFFGGVLDGLCEQGGASSTSGGLLYIVSCRDVSVINMTIKNAKCDCITLSRWGGQEKANERICIENCDLDTAWRQGVSIISAKNFRMSNCSILNIWGQEPGAALDFENNTSLECEKIENVVIENVFIKDTHSGILFPDQHNNPAENILIKNVKYTSSLNHRGNWFIPGSRMIVENCEFTSVNITNTYLFYANSSSREVIFRNCRFENNNIRIAADYDILQFHSCTFVGAVPAGSISAYNCTFKLIRGMYVRHAENCEIELNVSSVTDQITVSNESRFINNKLKINGTSYYAIATTLPIGAHCVISGNDIEADTQRATIYLLGTKHIIRNNRIFDVRQKSYGAIAEYNYGHRCQVYLNDIVRRVWIYASPAVSFRHPSLNYSTTGNTSERPQVLKQEDIGFKYYDTELQKFIFLKDNGKYPKFKLQLSASDLNNAKAVFATDFGIAEQSDIPAQTTLSGLTSAIADALSYKLADVHSSDPETGEIVFCVARNEQLTTSDITMTLGGEQLGTLTLSEAGNASVWIDAAGTAV